MWGERRQIDDCEVFAEELRKHSRFCNDDHDQLLCNIKVYSSRSLKSIFCLFNGTSMIMKPWLDTNLSPSPGSSMFVAAVTSWCH